MKSIGIGLFTSLLLSSLPNGDAFAPNKSGNHGYEKASASAPHMSTRTQSFYNSDPSLSNQFMSKPQQMQSPEQPPSKLIALRDPRGIITGFTTDPSLGDFPMDPSMNPGGQMALSRPMSSYQTVNVPYNPNQMQQQQQLGGNMQQGDPNYNYYNNPQMMGGYMGGYGMGYYNDWYMPNTVQGYDEYGNTVITDRRFDIYGNVRNYGGWGGWGGWGMW